MCAPADGTELTCELVLAEDEPLSLVGWLYSPLDHEPLVFEHVSKWITTNRETYRLMGHH